jgi:hypothetical protein
MRAQFDDQVVVSLVPKEIMLNPLRKAWRAGWRVRVCIDEHIGRKIHEIVIRHTKGHVWSGPFQGMRYIDQSFCSALMPKLLGLYERELHSSVESLVEWRPDKLFDIGSAEGYYAVGMAKRLPACEVLAYEMDKPARNLLKDLVSVNDSKNIRVFGQATCESLNAQVAAIPAEAKIAVICDCEGEEITLLKPTSLPWLRRAFVICELHECFRSGLEREMCGRFKQTHEVHLVAAVPRHRSEFPLTSGVMGLCPNYCIQMAIGEARPAGMKWMVAKPLS